MRILIDEAIPGATDRFRRLGEVRTFPGRSLTPAAARDADALIVRSVTRVDEALLAGSRVRFVGSTTSGTDHIDTAYLARRGIPLTHAPGCNARPVAEYVLTALVLMAVRRGLRPEAATLGVVGAGRIGSLVAHWAAALGMTVLHNDPPRRRAGDPGPWTDLPDLLAASDFVTLHVPLSDAGPDPTRDLIDAPRLAALRPGAVLINTARGEVVSEPALAEALAAGRPAGLVLDVWPREPDLPAKLATRVDIATPHVAGHSHEARRRAAAAVFRALADRAGRSHRRPAAEPGWYGRPARDPTPTDPHPARKAPAGGPLGDIGPLAALLSAACDLEKIDGSLRAALRAGGGAEGFDRLRAACSARREFTAHRFDPARFGPRAIAFLTTVGFRPGP